MIHRRDAEPLSIPIVFPLRLRVSAVSFIDFGSAALGFSNPIVPLVPYVAKIPILPRVLRAFAVDNDSKP